MTRFGQAAARSAGGRRRRFACAIAGGLQAALSGPTSALGATISSIRSRTRIIQDDLGAREQIVEMLHLSLFAE
jgi:hypothetical protein